MKSKRIQSTSEIGNIIMSIDNLHQKFEPKIEKKNGTQDTRLRDFNDLKFRGENAIAQLEKIQNNIIDKQKLIKRLDEYYAGEQKKTYLGT